MHWPKELSSPLSQDTMNPDHLAFELKTATKSLRQKIWNQKLRIISSNSVHSLGSQFKLPWFKKSCLTRKRFVLLQFTNTYFFPFRLAGWTTITQLAWRKLEAIWRVKAWAMCTNIWSNCVNLSNSKSFAYNLFCQTLAK